MNNKSNPSIPTSGENIKASKEAIEGRLNDLPKNCHNRKNQGFRVFVPERIRTRSMLKL